jgi:hypothetical protein
MEFSEHTPEGEQARRREWLVANMKERGLDDPEVREKLIAWTDALHAERAPDHSADALDPMLDRFSGVRNTIEQAILLRDAGFIDEEREHLSYARMDADGWGEQGQALCKEIDDLIVSLG